MQSREKHQGSQRLGYWVGADFNACGQVRWQSRDVEIKLVISSLELSA